MCQISGFFEEIQANRESTNGTVTRRLGCWSICLLETGHSYSVAGVTTCITGALSFNVTFIRCHTVSEIGIEKVVVELNSFRQRTAMIKEEITKVSRALNERAAQLNDLVNKSLGQLKEQLGGTTLSGYLSLQGRYQSGDMNDQDYSQQKDYYRGELQNMIRKLDESKKLMMIMAQLDSRQPGAQAPPGQQRPQPSQ